VTNPETGKQNENLNIAWMGDVMIQKFKIQNLDVRDLVLYLGSKSKIQNPKSKIQNPKSKIQNPKSDRRHTITLIPSSFRPPSRSLG
jgi:hypothetical protein